MWEGVGARAEAERFARLWGINGTILLDEQGEFAARLGIRGVPANVLVAGDGTVTAVGATTPDDLEAAVRELLGPGADIEPAPRVSWLGRSDRAHVERHVAPGNGAAAPAER